ncbi:hypothetical protein [Janibacter limosus]|jgi:hypothetical protein|uniref:Uncharacterized protein n=1 Tax=Janibacter limosus TaxID=53458 RepID=A0A4P6MQ48_9MICO|nr:hypothetical protein [Janibacter limosus]QBF45711.1 hypothetical protein EXU32_05210 [Janibacter limosus]
MRTFLLVLAAVCAGVGVLFLTAALAWMLSGGSGVTGWVIASSAPFSVAAGAGLAVVWLDGRSQ